MTTALAKTQRYTLSRATRIVPYLTPEEVHQIARAARASKKGARAYLLITLLFQTGLRISEALSLTPRHIGRYEGLPVLHIRGKGKKDRLVACPERLANSLRSYAYEHKLGLDDRFFSINRSRAFQIIQAAAKRAGITKKVNCHLFRHSDAIYRLRETGNPKALQLHLGHSSPMMTMRYLSTLTAEDALRIEQEVEFGS